MLQDRSYVSKFRKPLLGPLGLGDWSLGLQAFGFGAIIGFRVSVGLGH